MPAIDASAAGGIPNTKRLLAAANTTMDWKDLAGTLAKAGAPIIGTALGGPIGGMIGGALGNVIATALGTEATPEAVNDAVTKGDPQVIAAKLNAAEAEAQAKWPA